MRRPVCLRTTSRARMRQREDDGRVHSATVVERNPLRHFGLGGPRLGEESQA